MAAGAHAAHAEDGDDLERAQGCTGRKRHRTRESSPDDRNAGVGDLRIARNDTVDVVVVENWVEELERLAPRGRGSASRRHGQWVLPAQAGELREVAVGRAQHEAVLEGERSQVRVRY